MKRNNVIQESIRKILIERLQQSKGTIRYSSLLESLEVVINEKNHKKLLRVLTNMLRKELNNPSEKPLSSLAVGDYGQHDFAYIKNLKRWSKELNMNLDTEERMRTLIPEYEELFAMMFIGCSNPEAIDIEVYCELYCEKWDGEGIPF